ncbi:MAG TPA: helix-turn-helix transcriptional regulator [Thermoanaerobaculia bacterium]|jgi:transcriptional regulator with XRE-family HTH domain
MAASALELLGRKIRERRLEKGLTQERLAELCEMHHNHISSVERGLTNPTFLALLRIARSLDTSVQQLLEDFTPATVRRLSL